jgi:hypothetical protein
VVLLQLSLLLLCTLLWCNTQLFLGRFFVNASSVLNCLLIWNTWPVSRHHIVICIATASSWWLHHMAKVFLSVLFKLSQIWVRRIIRNSIYGSPLLGSILADVDRLLCLIWVVADSTAILSCASVVVSVDSGSICFSFNMISRIVFQKLFDCFLILLVLRFTFTCWTGILVVSQNVLVAFTSLDLRC